MKELKIVTKFDGQYFERNDYKVRTDEMRVQQILLNLLSNAIKYTEKEDSEITIRAIIGTKMEKLFLRISVQDQGTGISKSDQKKLFKLYGALRNKKDKKLNKKGVGLGLCICKQISNEFGGDIYVTSRLKVGSVFTFEFELDGLNEQHGPLTIAGEFQELEPLNMESEINESDSIDENIQDVFYDLSNNKGASILSESDVSPISPIINLN